MKKMKSSIKINGLLFGVFTLFVSTAVQSQTNQAAQKEQVQKLISTIQANAAALANNKLPKAAASNGSKPVIPESANPLINSYINAINNKSKELAKNGGPATAKSSVPSASANAKPNPASAAQIAYANQLVEKINAL